MASAGVVGGAPFHRRPSLTATRIRTNLEKMPAIAAWQSVIHPAALPHSFFQGHRFGWPCDVDEPPPQPFVFFGEQFSQCLFVRHCLACLEPKQFWIFRRPWLPPIFGKLATFLSGLWSRIFRAFFMVHLLPKAAIFPASWRCVLFLSPLRMPCSIYRSYFVIQISRRLPSGRRGASLTMFRGD